MEPVDMLICMLSACCTQSDVLSASRFFATLKPIVLPALRRLSAVRGLNMLQTLFSYTMEATIEDNAGTDSVLAENIEFLKMFDQAVDRMHEELISVADIRMALNTAVQTAANFLLSTPKYPCNSKVRSGQKFVQQQIGQLVENFNLMNRLAPNSQQKGPSFVTSREKISRLLIDRIAFMDITPTSLQVMSPVFKSPKVQTIIAKSGTDVDLCNSPPLKTEGSNEVVPARKLASFLNNNTPTPTRPNVRSCMFNSGDSGFEDVLEENCSDVILPVESSPLKPLKNITPHRPKTKGLRVLKNQEVRKRPATKADIAPTKRSKVSQPSSQKSITSFFIRK